MTFIENCSLANILKGNHYDAPILIQIVDPDAEFPQPFHTFEQVHQFKFLDLEQSDDCINDKWKISDQQALDIIKILTAALDNKQSVIVHCTMGVCRSGAVAEVGVMMGFDDAERWRIPNTLVKQKLMAANGWRYEDQI